LVSEDWMTEREWLESDNPNRLLAFLDRHGQVTERKRRLFACACSRGVWHLLADERSREAVRISEQYADGLADAGQLARARRAARAARTERRQDARRGRLGRAALQAQRAAHQAAVGTWSHRAAAQAAGLERGAAVEGAAGGKLRAAWRTCLAVLPRELTPLAWQSLALPVWKAVAAEQAEALAADAAGRAAERSRQARLLRELVSNPFRPARIDPAWLHWNGGTVVRLAQSIAEAQRFTDLPILADALEDAGCNDQVILNHCRHLAESEHLRGCWVIDCILGRE
jgi:hypothetical protein